MLRLLINKVIVSIEEVNLKVFERFLLQVIAKNEVIIPNKIYLKQITFMFYPKGESFPVQIWNLLSSNAYFRSNKGVRFSRRFS